MRAVRQRGPQCKPRRDQPRNLHDGYLGLQNRARDHLGRARRRQPAFSFRAAARRWTSADRAIDRQACDYDQSKDPAYKPLGPTRLRPDGVWDRGGQNLFSSPVHKSATVDYGILLEGERTLLLDRGNVVLKPGDVVVQLGNWHGWTNVNGGSLMAFVMMGATFEAEPKVQEQPWTSK